ncbi:RagB/SusD family nutrient uptake outer membrane protein [Arcticibacter eurypsychrophilus]|uniref:RagB/SusD family nutrient uptake outer membrane protein n=1 Tax=Arcticibacter eurypsychrophilus TaxID=1434752 RepID=UPI00084DB830|nr:RagB/SusD family nutrient uptake outer membrane protein [Arcticibacter eurypsychrophilus]
MKTNKYIITCITAGLIVLSGCSKDFLEVSPQGQLTEDQVLKDPNAANQLVGGVYSTLYFGGFDNTTVGFLFECLNDMASDDTDKGSSPSDFSAGGEIDNFTVTANNFVLNNIWQGHYSAINRANKAIDVLTQSTFDEGVKNTLIGEVRFLRGIYYFNMVRCFGGVPKVIRTPDPSEGNSDEFQTRSTKEEIYQVILDDLQFAADNLPEKGSTEVGRATKGAAQSYLAKVYMYQKNWAKVLENTTAVINSGRYNLVNDYSLIFRENAVGNDGGNNNVESIFEVQTGINLGENAVSLLYSNGQGPRSKGGWNDLGFGINTPSSDLANAYEANDKRRAASIIFINPTVIHKDGGNPLNVGTVLWDGFRIPTQDSVENERYNYKAFHSSLKESPQVSNNKDSKPKNIRLMRYADVLLMYAEAQANLGNSGEAEAKLKLVRNRAGLVTVAGTVANIWNERRVELAMEQDRFFDLVRQGRAGTVLRAKGKAFVDGKNELFPIPQAQRDLSAGRLTQNPGY